MNTTILACSAGSPELFIFPAILCAVFGVPMLAAILFGVGSAVFNLGNTIQKVGERDAAGGPPPLPRL